MQQLLRKLRKDFPALNFTESDKLCWSPQNQQISYPKTSSGHTEQNKWSLLHELGHAVLGHQTYTSDIELIEMEAQAWGEAKNLAQKYNIDIDENYIQDCMDTYRDWLHMRSACPSCSNRSLQQNPKQYQCFNCGQQWKVSSSRFCRPYRKKANKQHLSL